MILALVITSVLLQTSCVIFRKAESDHLSNGSYRTLVNGQTQTVWLEKGEDTLRLEVLSKQAHSPILILKPLHTDTINPPMRFVKNTLDVDLLSIPVKIRPASGGIPTQLVTNINAALFVGFRKDIYTLHQEKQSRGHYRYQEFHHGFSLGLCSGIGSSPINAGFTKQQVMNDYEGVVWSNGIAGLIAIKEFTIGFMLGADNLLSKDRKNWIYQGKPWIGLAVGLNLN